MMTAIIRGFATMTVWSPLSVSFTVMQGAVPSLSWWPLLGVQLVLTALLMALGWLLDRRAFPPVKAPAGEAEAAGWRPIGQLAALVAAVVVTSVALAEVLGVRLVVGAMLVVPPAAILWLVAQHRGCCRPWPISAAS